MIKNHIVSRITRVLILSLITMSASFGVGAYHQEKPGTGIIGFWQGVLEAAGTKVRVIIKLSKGTEGTLIGKLDSPDQSMTDFSIDRITFDGKSLRFELPRLRANFEGMLNENGSEISGRWEQGGASLPLTFNRLDNM